MDENKAKKSNMFPVLTMAVIAVALIIVIVVVVANKATNQSTEANTSPTAKKSITQTDMYGQTQKPAAAKLTELNTAKAKNKDVKAWLSIPGTHIDIPVVQGSDNETYKTKNAEGKDSSLGWCFFDSHVVIGTRFDISRNAVIYGTDSTDTVKGSGFGQINDFSDIKYVSKNQYIYLTTPTDQLIYRVFAAFSPDDDSDITNVGMSDKQLMSLVTKAYEKSSLIYSTGVANYDKIITLYANSDSLSSGSGKKYVVLARLIHPNEKVDNSVIIHATGK